MLAHESIKGVVVDVDAAAGEHDVRLGKRQRAPAWRIQPRPKLLHVWRELGLCVRFAAWRRPRAQPGRYAYSQRLIGLGRPTRLPTQRLGTLDIARDRFARPARCSLDRAPSLTGVNATQNLQNLPHTVLPIGHLVPPLGTTMPKHGLGCRFRRKVDTDSDRRWTGIPIEDGHPIGPESD